MKEREAIEGRGVSWGSTHRIDSMNWPCILPPLIVPGLFIANDFGNL